MDYIDGLPLNAEPEVFGMHANANITCELNETDMALDVLVQLQPQDGGGNKKKGAAGGPKLKTRDEIVAEAAASILRYVTGRHSHGVLRIANALTPFTPHPPVVGCRRHLTSRPSKWRTRSCVDFLCCAKIHQPAINFFLRPRHRPPPPTPTPPPFSGVQ